MIVSAFAKINLSLDITGRRTDGYHTLRMVMQSISLCDTVCVEPVAGAEIRVLCNGGFAPCDRTNTAYRAAKAFQKAARVDSGGLNIEIQKRIPSEAGLGGGSADAAAVLRALNSVYRAGLSEDCLRKIGLSVGADVPFCVSGGTALVEGIGEKIAPVGALPECSIVVCRPSIGISTVGAYTAFDQSGSAPSHYTDSVLKALGTGSVESIGRSLGNTFEQAGVPDDIPQIERIMRTFGSEGACMTGSGSAVYGLFRRTGDAHNCRRALAQKYPLVFLCSPVGRYN